MSSPRTAIAAAASILLALPAHAYAAKPSGPGEDTPLNLPADPSTSHVSVGGGGGSLVRTIVGLAVVIGVIYGVAWLMRQMKQSREERTVGFGLRSEAVVALGPNRAVHLIRAGRELVLVGVAEHGVTPIRTYTEEEARRLGLIEAPDVDGGIVVDGVPVPSANGTPVPARPASIVDRLREWTARR